MADSGRVIDFSEAVGRLRRKKAGQLDIRALARIDKTRTVAIEEIISALSQHPELDCLRDKGIGPYHLAAWLDKFPAMSLTELIAILQFAARKIESGEDGRIIEYLFQTFS
jgi:hypothetical protein